VNSENVSEWVASKLRSIVACIGVAFPGHGKNEAIPILSGIEKNNCLPK